MIPIYKLNNEEKTLLKDSMRILINCSFPTINDRYWPYQNRGNWYSTIWAPKNAKYELIIADVENRFDEISEFFGPTPPVQFRNSKREIITYRHIQEVDFEAVVAMAQNLSMNDEKINGMG